MNNLSLSKHADAAVVRVTVILNNHSLPMF